MSANAAEITAFNTADAATMSGANQQRILRDPRFVELVRRRNSLAVVLSVVTLGIYAAFILLVAYNKPFLATRLGGGTTSLGIAFGLVVIVSAFLLTAIYVAVANGSFDKATEQLVQDYGR